MISWLGTHLRVGPFFVSLFLYTPMQEVTPKVVATAVRMVIRMFSILLQSCLFSIVSLVFSGWLMGCLVIVILSKTKNLSALRSLPPYEGG